MDAKSSILTEPLPGTPGSELVRSYVWEMPVRITHWTTFLAIVVLSATGYYIHDPYLLIRAKTAFVMGTARFIHVTAGFVLTMSFLVRVYWFFAGNRCASLNAFIPTSRRQWRQMGQMFKYYSFLRWRPVHRVGHNPLAGITYTLILLLLLVSILTGFVLFSWTAETGFLKTVFGWAAAVFGIQRIRLVHFLLMYIFIGFSIHHVYSAVLVSIEEKNGLLESIVTGYKYIPESELREDECAGPRPRRSGAA
jgi:Ni/Fe-hydrogenase 1 B-type cytochrome subunit